MCSFLLHGKGWEYIYILVLPPMISSETYQFALWKKTPSAILFLRWVAAKVEKQECFVKMAKKTEMYIFLL